MPEHRQESVRTPKSAFRESFLNTFHPRRNGEHRGIPTRNKVMAAVVATGALAAIGQPIAASSDNSEERAAAVQPAAQEQPLSAAVAGSENKPASVEILGAAPANNSLAEAKKIDKSQAIEQARVEKAAAEKAAAEKAAAEKAAAEKAAAERSAQARAVVPAAAQSSNGYIKPADGTFTSGFGARWGSSHKGIDLANSIGTPIKSVSAGEVINAGPASGFGQWVRVQHDDGTISVYGHINTIDVNVGQQVGAGEQIATMGNRGQSTGPHLHFEIIQGGQKINPLPWLESKGISVQ
ncbi:M23 family metallopeptidase [Parasphingorhabdus pacifica]